jgi:hypothetical protein
MWCCICKTSGESTDHLLIHCEIARELWSSILDLFSVNWVMPRWMIDMLVSWGGQVGRGIVMEVQRLSHLCLMWFLR